MRGGVAAADWPRLAPADLAPVLRGVGIDPGGAALEWHSARPLSSAGIVRAGGVRLFIKRHDRRVRRIADLEQEHAFMGHLRARGIPVSRVLAAADGHSAIAVGTWTYEVHELGRGVDAYRDAQSWTPFASAAHAFGAGRALAELHAVARSYAAPPRSAPVLESNDRLIAAADPIGALAAELPLRPVLGAFLEARAWRTDFAHALAPFHPQYRRCSARLARVWTHNDWHASNLLWSDAGLTAHVAGIIDFGLCDCTTRTYDLATAIERNTIPWLDIQDGRRGSADLALVTALLAGYLDRTELSERECAALVAILPLVHWGYALSEIEYFHGVTRSAENADLAYDAFLLGHCRWFTEPEGEALLRHLETTLGAVR
jgi:Ser/Thr protein kinase RdoA (MazF antagonist)